MSEILAIDKYMEMGAFEHLWSNPNITQKKFADYFREGKHPSDIVAVDDAKRLAKEVKDILISHNVEHFGLRVKGTFDFPKKLLDARNPVEVLYYMGNWDLVYAPKQIAVVGARIVSAEGIRRTHKLVKGLVENDFTIISGLAEGVDTAAHKMAIACKGKTYAVIGTPLHQNYPKSNAILQKQLASDYLVISQIPVLRYEYQDYRKNRSFFPERNITMSALSDATLIVEASDTSGTLGQARAALAQGRKLFILDSNFRNKNLRWPHTLLGKGAIRVRKIEDILNEFEL